MLIKKKLLEIPLPDPPEELIKTAQEDRCIKRDLGALGKAVTYGTKLYFSAAETEGYLVIQVWTRAMLAEGRYEPAAVTYIEPAEGRWISRKRDRWTPAMLNAVKNEYENQWNTSWRAEDISTEEDKDLCQRILKTPRESVKVQVYTWQRERKDEENKRRAERRKAAWDRTLSAIPPAPPGFEKWAKTEGTVDDNFLLFRRKKDQTEVLCTNCGRTSTTINKLGHNPKNPMAWDYKKIYFAKCPNCGMFLQTKSWGMQKKMRTESCVVLPQVAGELISMRSFTVRKEFKRTEGAFGQEHWSKEEKLIETGKIFCDPKTFESVDSYIEEYVPQLGKCCWRRKRWHDYKGTQYSYQINKGVMYQGNAEEICRISGMYREQYEYCKGDQHTSPQRMLIAMAKKKYIEYLIKAGLKNLAREELECGHLRKDAKNLKQLLGLNGQQVWIMKQIDGRRKMISELQEIQARGEKVDLNTLRTMNEQKLWIEDMATEETGMTVQRTVNYLARQAAKENRTLTRVAGEYRDYLRVAGQMGRDTTDSIICRTPDLKAMHDRYVEEYNRHKDDIRAAAVDGKFKRIALRAGEIAEHFAYEKEGLAIVAPKKASEIVAEGREQHHCVGASDIYMKRMDEGESYILFLRRKEDLKAPYYTLEVNWDGTCRQSYAAYDRRPDAEKIDEWLRSFTRAIRKRTEKEQERTRVMAAV